MRSVHIGMRMSFSVLSALLFLLPIVFLSKAQADWLVREDAELAPITAPTQTSQEPAPHAEEEKLEAPQQPEKAVAKTSGCPHQAKKDCPPKKKIATGACNATKPLDRNATGANAAQFMENAVEFRVQSLAQVKSDDPKVVELVAEKLSDKKPKLRREAVAVLGLLSAYHPEKAAEIFPYLLKAINDSDPKVRGAVLKGLLPTVAHLEEDTGVGLLNDALAKGNSLERNAVAVVVANLAGKLPWAGKLSGALQNVLQDPNQDTKLSAIMALALIDPSLLPEGSETILKENTRSKAPGTRFQAYSLLAVLGAKSIGALPELLRGADDPHNVPRWAAIRALGSLGQDTVLAHPEILDALIKATGDSDLPVQQMAALCLGKNLSSPALPGVLPGVKNDAAMDALKKMLESKQPYIAQTAAWALVRMDPKLRGTLPEKIRAKLPESTPALDKMAAQ